MGPTGFLGVLLLVVAQRELEPRTPGVGERWHDRARRESRESLSSLPADYRSALGDGMDGVTTRWTDGLRAGETRLVPGMPAVREQSGSAWARGVADARRAVVDAPAHARAAAGALAAGHREASGHLGAEGTAALDAAAAGQAMVQRATDDTGDGFRGMDAETQRDRAEATASWADNTDQAWTGAREDAATERADAAMALAGHRVEAGERWEARKAALLASQGGARTRAHQAPAQTWDTSVAHLRARDAVASERIGAAVLGLTQAPGQRWAEARATTAAGRARNDLAYDGTRDRLHENSRRRWQEFDDASDVTAQRTVERAPGAVGAVAHSAGVDARGLWHLGYVEYLQGGMASAADNGFAGDAEGFALAGWYSSTSVVQAAGIILLLEPLAAVAHAAAGATLFTGLAGGGAGALAAIQGVRVGWLVLSTLVGGALLGMLRVGHAVDSGLSIVAGFTTALFTGAAWLAATGAAVTWSALVAAVTAAAGLASTALVAGGVWAYVAWTHSAAWALGGAAHAGWVMGRGLWLLASSAVRVSWPWVRGAGAAVAETAWLLGVVGILEVLRGVHRVHGVAALVGQAALVMAVAAGAAGWHALVAGPVGAWALVTLGWGRAAHALGEAPGAALFHGARGAGGLALGTGFHAALATGGAAWVVASTTTAAGARAVGEGTRHTVAGTAGAVERLVADLRFDLHEDWANFRRPHLDALLQAQPDAVRAEVGTTVRYVRVRMSGSDRGKVLFFTVDKDGSTRKFYRLVDSECRVRYAAAGGGTTLQTGQSDADCLDGRMP
ncbi:MAG: hypothetical protein HY904_05830 [Deltaproteobacteria bacterium]|nr:hypothetical protein [Deltaproteobacteria bacterium]